MTRSLLLLFAFGLFAASTLAQAEGLNFDSGTLEKVKPASIAWTWDEGVYNTKEEPHTVYLLMNTGGAVKPQISGDFRELVKSWLAAHPNAEAFVVTTIPGVSTKLGWTFKPVWVTDHDEMLNVYLVRRGACSAGTMLLSENWANALTSEQYKGVHKKLWEAEFLARKEKLGIWTEPQKQ